MIIIRGARGVTGKQMWTLAWERSPSPHFLLSLSPPLAGGALLPGSRCGGIGEQAMYMGRSHDPGASAQ